MKLPQPRLLAACAVLALPLVACGPVDSAKIPAAPSAAADKAAGTAAATVNGFAISESAIKSLAKGQAVDGDMRKQILDHLTMQVVIAQEAAKKGLDKTPEVADQIDIARQAILAKAFIQDYLKSTPITDEMLKAEYERAKTELAGNELKIRHILVGSEVEAKDLIARLKKSPGEFGTLAKTKSKDPQARANGGDLGWMDPQGLLPEIAGAVSKLAKGQFTDAPVKSQLGYHVFLLEDTRAKTLPPFEQIKSGLQQQAQQQALKKYLDGVRASAKIEVAPPPVSAVASVKDDKVAAAAKDDKPAAPAKEEKPAAPAK